MSILSDIFFALASAHLRICAIALKEATTEIVRMSPRACGAL